MDDQPIVVRVEQAPRGCGCGGCGTAIVVLIIVGLLVTHWQVALAAAAVAALIGAGVRWYQRAHDEPPAANRGALWSGSTPAPTGTCPGCGRPVASAFCPDCGSPTGL